MSTDLPSLEEKQGINAINNRCFPASMSLYSGSMWHNSPLFLLIKLCCCLYLEQSVTASQNNLWKSSKATVWAFYASRTCILLTNVIFPLSVKLLLSYVVDIHIQQQHQYADLNLCDAMFCIGVGNLRQPSACCQNVTSISHRQHSQWPGMMGIVMQNHLGKHRCCTSAL